MTNKKYKVNYVPSKEFKESTNTCKFCLRLVYFDSQHLNDYDVPVPHDRPVCEYRNLEKVPHHANHCPDLTGTAEDKLYYKKLREAQGKPDPYYKTEVDVSNAGINIKQSTLDPESQSQVGRPIGPAIKYNPGETTTMASQEDIDKLNEAIKTLEIKFEVLTASFNDYVGLTMKAIKGFLDDVHNNMTEKDRIETRAGNYLNDVREIKADVVVNMTDQDKQKLEKYFEFKEDQ